MIVCSTCTQPAYQRKKHYPGNDMPWNTVAVAHDNDLQLMERMVGPSQNTYAHAELERVHHGARRTP
jgi:hypothetical protein